MKNLFNRFVREEQGQDLIEYALLAGLISLASVVAITGSAPRSRASSRSGVSGRSLGKDHEIQSFRS